MSQPVVESPLFRARRQLGAEYDEVRSGRRCGIVQTEIAKAPTPPGSHSGCASAASSRAIWRTASPAAVPPGRRVWTNPSSAPRPCRRRSPRSCRCFHRCVGTVAPPRRIPPSLARCRWRRDRWGRERCRRSMRSGTQAVHWAGSGGRRGCCHCGSGTGGGGGRGGGQGRWRPQRASPSAPSGCCCGDLQSPPKQPDPRAASLGATGGRVEASSTRPQAVIRRSPSRASAGTARPYVHRAGGQKVPGGRTAPGGTRSRRLGGKL